MKELQNDRQGKSSIAPAFSKRGYNKFAKNKSAMIPLNGSIKVKIKQLEIKDCTILLTT